MSATADPAQYARLKDLHFELDALSPGQRAARLLELDASEPTLAAQLRRRFGGSARPLDILDRAERSQRDAANLQLAHYRIVRELGRGGMGRVWLAEREMDGAAQLVALKQIAVANWSDEDERRFQRERRILASLDHPNIAALVDGGRDPSGAPYMATVFVDGARIDRWCSERAAPRRERVRLIHDIASAVAYAHRKLVVHRDLKPANILVSGDGIPKLLDFGIARLLDEDAITATGPSQMTLRYAAPEQIHGAGAGGVGVDIYALGVLLYELLAECSPYGRTEGTGGLVRAILESNPTAPTRVLGPVDADLDAICLKALRKRPEDRYASAEEMQADLERWLQGAAVDARRDERGYRLRTFLRRHWIAVSTGVAILVAGFAFLAFHIASLDRQLAETQRERDKARAVASYFQELFQAAGPGETSGDSLTARELLRRSVDRLEQGDRSALGDDARASMYHAAARIMHEQGLLDEAARMFDRALALWLAQPQVPEDDVADVLNERSRIAFTQGHYQSSLDLLDQAIGRREAMGDDRSGPLGVLLQTRAVTLRVMGRHAEASDSLARAVKALAHNLPESAYNHAIALGNLGTFMLQQGRAQEGHEQLTAAVAALSAMVPERTQTLLATQRNLATSLRELGRFDDAEREYATVLERMRQFFGPIHLEVARTQHSLAQTLIVRGHLAEAEQALDAAERIEHELGNDNDPRVLAYRADRARIRIAEGRFADAEALLAPVLAQRDAGVRSERSYVSAERAALLYARCRQQPGPEVAKALRAAAAQLEAELPLPFVLLAQAQNWAEECSSLASD